MPTRSGALCLGRNLIRRVEFMIVIRHPQWRANDPYQDIPIMVFTRSQWDADKQGAPLELDAAPLFRAGWFRGCDDSTSGKAGRPTRTL